VWTVERECVESCDSQGNDKPGLMREALGHVSRFLGMSTPPGKHLAGVNGKDATSVGWSLQVRLGMTNDRWTFKEP
jgi:hypothetical protein